jgi:small subunit ribosomal protein S8
MTMTDPIADLLTRIRNACKARHPKVDVPSSNVKKNILQVLKEEGYIDNYTVSEESKKKDISVTLKYHGDALEPVITAIKRVSKPGRRIYVEKAKIPKVLNGLGIAIISTSKGVISGDKAKKLNIGGEFLCKVW